MMHQGIANLTGNTCYTNSRRYPESETHGENAPAAGHASNRKSNSCPEAASELRRKFSVMHGLARAGQECPPGPLSRRAGGTIAQVSVTTAQMGVADHSYGVAHSRFCRRRTSAREMIEVLDLTASCSS